MIDLLRFGLFTFEGDPVDDEETFERLPAPLRDVLMRANGFVAWRGAFHLRGACRTPSWHALATVWDGELSLHRAYPGVEPSDVPFAQDALGDQFLLRRGRVLRLWAEVGDLDDTGYDLMEFLRELQRDPWGLLDIQPLEVFEAEGARLRPGQLLHADPPFCQQEGDEEVALRAVDAEDRLYSLMELARLGPTVTPALAAEIGEGGVDLLELARLRALKPR
jgi:hypothetical protein